MKEELKKIFQDHYSETSTEVDAAKLLKAIAEKRNPKTKRRWLILLPIGLLLPVLYFSIVAFNNRVPSQIVNSIPDIHPHTNSAIIEQSPEQSKVHASVDALDETKSAKVIVNATTENRASDSKSKDLQLSQKPTAYRDRANSKKQLHNIKYTSQINVKKKATSFSKFQNDLLVKESNSILESPINNASSFLAGSKEVLTKVNGKVAKKRFNLAVLSAIENIHSTIVILQEPVELNLTKVINLEEVALVQTSKVNLKFLAGGLSYSSSTEPLSAIDAGLVEAFDKAASPFSSMDFSIVIDYRIDKRIGVSVGLSYTRLSELFEWKDSYIADEKGNYIVSNTNTDDLFYSLVGVSSELNYFENITREIVNYNHQYYLDLPITLSYRLIDNKLKTDIYAGLAINLLKHQNGYTLSQDLVPERVITKPAIGMEWQIGLEFGYELSTHFSALLRTEFAVRKKRTIYDEQRIYQPSIKAGLGYKF